ncbi:MAG TPA: hypothetical protein VM221_10125 [Armatimonadota bacterium]|nr:hypothetical protein [Armatimonadota bacterium]
MHHSLGTLGYGNWFTDWLGEKFQPIVTKAGDPLRTELETGGAKLKGELAAGGRELQEELERGGAQLRREMAAGEAKIRQTTADTIVLGGAAMIGLFLWVRK